MKIIITTILSIFLIFTFISCTAADNSTVNFPRIYGNPEDENNEQASNKKAMEKICEEFVFDSSENVKTKSDEEKTATIYLCKDDNTLYTCYNNECTETE